MPKTRNAVFFLSFFIHSIVLFGQNMDDSIELKYRIEKLIKANDVMSVNRILNQNTSLEMEYVFSILTQNIEISKEKDDNEALAYTYLSLGNFWFMQSNQVKAYDNYYQSEQISRKNKINSITGLAIMNRSNLSQDAASRIILLKEAIDYFNSEKDLRNLAKAHLNLGNAYSSMVIGPSVLNMTGFTTDTVSNTLLTVDNLYYKDTAFVHYQIAEKLNETIQHPEISASIHLRHAQWFVFEKNFEMAEINFNQAAINFSKADLLKGRVFCMLELAGIKIIQMKTNEAQALLQQVLEISEKQGFRDYYAEGCKNLVGLYEKKTDYKKALKYQQLYTSSVINLNNVISQDKIHALNLDYSLKDQQHLIQAMNQKRKINNLFLFLISFLFLSLSIVTYLMILNRRRKIRSLSESIHKNNQLNTIQVQLMKTQMENEQLQKQLLEEKVISRSESLVLFANQLNKLESYYDSLSQEMKNIAENIRTDEGVQKLKGLKHSLIQIAHEQKSLKELSSLSNQINQDFFFHIEKHFEKITKDDKQLLSYLILDMNSKEIGQLLNISTESVHKKRYRLRKKLNIATEKTFNEFYKEIIKQYSYPGISET